MGNTIYTLFSGTTPMKKCISKMLDNSTKPRPFCLLSSPLLETPHAISSAPLLTELAYLCMLFILLLLGLVNERIKNIAHRTSFGDNVARGTELGSVDSSVDDQWGGVDLYRYLAYFRHRMMFFLCKDTI